MSRFAHSCTRAKRIERVSPIAVLGQASVAVSLVVLPLETGAAVVEFNRVIADDPACPKCRRR